jgi:hypothetical protein
VGLFDAFRNTNGGNQGKANEPVNTPPAPGSDSPVTPQPVSQDITSSVTPSNDYVAPVADQANPAMTSYASPTDFAADNSTTTNQENDTSDLAPGTTTVDDSSASTTAPLPPVISPSNFAVPTTDPNLGDSSQNTESPLSPADSTLPNPVAPTSMDDSFASQSAPDVQPAAMPTITTPEATEPEVVPSTENNQGMEDTQAPQTAETSGGSDNQFPTTPNDSTPTV